MVSELQQIKGHHWPMVGCGGVGAYRPHGSADRRRHTRRVYFMSCEGTAAWPGTHALFAILELVERANTALLTICQGYVASRRREIDAVLDHASVVHVSAALVQCLR